MEYPVEEIISYPLPALFVLAVFYGIYFAKMLARRAGQQGLGKALPNK